MKGKLKENQHEVSYGARPGQESGATPPLIFADSPTLNLPKPIPSIGVLMIVVEKYQIKLWWLVKPEHMIQTVNAFSGFLWLDALSSW